MVIHGEDRLFVARRKQKKSSSVIYHALSILIPHHHDVEVHFVLKPSHPKASSRTAVRLQLSVPSKHWWLLPGIISSKRNPGWDPIPHGQGQFWIPAMFVAGWQTWHRVQVSNCPSQLSQVYLPKYPSLIDFIQGDCYWVCLKMGYSTCIKICRYHFSYWNCRVWVYCIPFSDTPKSQVSLCWLYIPPFLLYWLISGECSQTYNVGYSKHCKYHQKNTHNLLSWWKPYTSIYKITKLYVISIYIYM